MEELLRLGGADMDLQELARWFSAGPARVEKGEGYYLLVLKSEAPRTDAELLEAGTNELALLNAIKLANDPNFQPATIQGVTRKNADGTLSHVIHLKGIAAGRAAMFCKLTVLGPDGKAVENKAPTEGELARELATKNEPLNRALRIYGSMEHDWVNLYKVLEAMEDGNGGERGLVAKNFVPGKDIKDFKNTANSWRAIDMKSRHATPTIGSPDAKLTLAEAQEMFRELFQSWTQELKNQSDT